MQAGWGHIKDCEKYKWHSTRTPLIPLATNLNLLAMITKRSRQDAANYCVKLLVKLVWHSHIALNTVIFKLCLKWSQSAQENVSSNKDMASCQRLSQFCCCNFSFLWRGDLSLWLNATSNGVSFWFISFCSTTPYGERSKLDKVALSWDIQILTTCLATCPYMPSLASILFGRAK